MPDPLGYAEINFIGEPSKNRTCNLLIKSELLYLLSYGFIKLDEPSRLFAHLPTKNPDSDSYRTIPCVWDKFGGPGRNRSLDLLVKSQLLFRLSYEPIKFLVRRPGNDPGSVG